MINVNSLRIGNLITYDIRADTKEIMEVSIGDMYRIEENNGEGYDGITINHIALKELGFTKQSNGFLLNYEGGAILVSNDSTILFSGSEYSLNVAMDYETLNLTHEVKQVHELQNLLFVLTGKEQKPTRGCNLG